MSLGRQAGPLDGQATGSTGITQPKPQALPRRAGPTSIIVSKKQDGNPVLSHIKSLPWEWGDIPADFVLGLTTCALFLQLKYHKIHPEYIYKRIKDLQGKYNLRIIMVLVDIENHEESIKELTKTSLVNNVTLILCWSAAEGGRYLELFKTYENAAPTSIKQHQSTSYSDRMVDFITKPRSINKTDAVSLVSQFGSIRTAVNARHEDVAGIAGWGEKKVERWCRAVREPFRAKNSARQGLVREEGSFVQNRSGLSVLTSRNDASKSSSMNKTSNSPSKVATDAEKGPATPWGEEMPVGSEFEVGEEARSETRTGLADLQDLEAAELIEPPKKRKKVDDEGLSEELLLELSKLRRSN